MEFSLHIPIEKYVHEYIDNFQVTSMLRYIKIYVYIIHILWVIYDRESREERNFTKLKKNFLPAIFNKFPNKCDPKVCFTKFLRIVVIGGNDIQSIRAAQKQKIN